MSTVPSHLGCQANREIAVDIVPQPHPNFMLDALLVTTLPSPNLPGLQTHMGFCYLPDVLLDLPWLG